VCEYEFDTPTILEIPLIPFAYFMKIPIGHPSPTSKKCFFSSENHVDESNFQKNK